MKTKTGRVAVLLFIALLWGPIFFSVCSIAGLNFYEEREAKVPVFMYSYMVVDMIVLYNYCKMIKQEGLTKGDLKFWGIILLFFLIYSVDTPICIDGHMHFRLFIAESVPAMFISSLISRKKMYPQFVKCFDILMLIISLGLVMNFHRYLSGNVGIGGGTSQALSYYSAFAFSINLFFLLFGKEISRFSIFQTQKFSFVALSLLPIQVISCFIGGGRGAVVLMIVSLLLFLLFIYKKRKMKIFNYLTMGLFSVIIGLFSLPSKYNNLMSDGYERAFSYINEEGELDVTETSNRDIIYKKAMDAICVSPLIGYGLFAYTDVLGCYPHNMVLEVLMQGGVLYGIFFFFVFFLLIVWLYRTSFLNSNVMPLWLFFLYSFVDLSFSGSYMRNPLFWFLIGTCVIFGKKNVRIGGVKENRLIS
ncbi:MAG: O-antigen ligase family protein [Paludibacteraceae bacterium]|nr:O-antigen ligase family protein [Paludibacteraceae bacterium]